MDSSAEKSRTQRTKRAESGSEGRAPKGGRRRIQPPSGAPNEALADDSEGEEFRDPLGEESSSDDDRRPRRRRERAASPFSTIVYADNQAVAGQLFTHLQTEFALVGVQLVTAKSDPDLIVSLGSPREFQPVERTHPVLVILGKQDSQDLLRVAAENNGIFLPMEAISRRVEPPALAETISDQIAFGACADAVRNTVLMSERGALVRTERLGSVARCAEAKSLAGSAAEVLQALDWRGKSPPGSIRPRADIQSIEGFLDGVIKFREAGKRDALAFPHDWSVAPETSSAADAVYSLDFLAAVLNYWFQKANRSSSKVIGRIDALVKQRDMTASAMLARCTDVMLGCLSNAADLPKQAWQTKVAMRRARAMLLYLLCCRAAAQRRIKFDEQSLVPVFRALVDLLDQLRWASYLELGEASAVSRTASIAGLALSLRKTQFGKDLLEQALQAVSQHVEVGLTSDGFWREGFVQHDAAFRSLKRLSTDLQTAEVPSGSIKAQLMHMAQFVSAFLRDDGYAPPLPGITPKKYRFTRAAAQSLLRNQRAVAGTMATQGDLPDAKIFPEARFFFSRSAAPNGGATSHFALHAASSTFGGPTLSFCCGPMPVLVGGGTTDRKASVDIRRATQRDPGAHNAFRVDGRSYRDVNEDDLSSVQISAVWGEKSWTAAQLTNRLFAPASIKRTLIHLKPLHGLLIVDELRANGGPLQFEQFWHVAPGLALRDRRPPQFHFTFERGERGGVAVAFDRSARIVLKKGGSGPTGWTSTEKRESVANPYFIREITTANGLLASFFRCVGGDAKHDVSVAQTGSGWKVVLLCAGRQIAFVHEGDQLKLIS